ncbi:hypothetical protein LI170_16465, partial [Desulfovibrio desulfuricans]|nr:hypothetical protein [Desulfovibrio desulfuricans]
FMKSKTSDGHEQPLMNAPEMIFVSPAPGRPDSLSLASFAHIYMVKEEACRGGCEPMSVIKQRKLLSGLHQKG